MKSGWLKISREKSNIHFQSDQIYETFYLNCYMLSCLIQFSMLENGKSDSRKISWLKKQFTLPKGSNLWSISSELLHVYLFD